MSEFYEQPGAHYFWQAQERDDGYYIRSVTPLIGGLPDRGYYRVRSWKRVQPDMVDAFKADHPEKDRPDGWDDAELEHA